MHRTRVLYICLALTTGVILALCSVTHHFHNWVSFENDPGKPSFGFWQACYTSPDFGRQCDFLHHAEYYWLRKVCRNEIYASAAFFITLMSISALLFIFAVLTITFPEHIGYYYIPPLVSSVPLVLSAVVVVVMMRGVVIEKLIKHYTNPFDQEDEEQFRFGLAAYTGFTSCGLTAVVAFISLLILVLKPDEREERRKEFILAHGITEAELTMTDEPRGVLSTPFAYEESMMA